MSSQPKETTTTAAEPTAPKAGLQFPEGKLFPTNLAELYSGDDMDSLFKGGFICFGYWDDVLIRDENVLTDDDYIGATVDLHEKVFETLDLQKTDDVLDVGSGHGGGSGLLAGSGLVNSVTGLDHFAAHVAKAQKRNQKLIKTKNLHYVVGDAEKMPFADETFDKLYTNEAFQHFNPEKALKEFYRVLKKGGRFTICTIFINNRGYIPEVLTLIPKAAILSDFGGEEIAALPNLVEYIKTMFTNVKVSAIGNHVWKGYDKWVRQNEPGIWDCNWLKSYKRGLIDYYLVSADKP